MQEAFEKIIERLEELCNDSISNIFAYEEDDHEGIYNKGLSDGYEKSAEIVKQAAAEYNNGWIPCSERLPENEKEVEITFIRQHYKTGEILYLTARAFYEDGTLTTEDSGYGWNETDNWEYCEEKDACIIPEGWYEGVSFTEQFGIVDTLVIAWRYLTEPHQPKGE